MRTETNYQKPEQMSDSLSIRLCSSKEKGGWMNVGSPPPNYKLQWTVVLPNCKLKLVNLYSTSYNQAMPFLKCFTVF